jgi:hypothetical protein
LDLLDLLLGLLESLLLKLLSAKQLPKVLREQRVMEIKFVVPGQKKKVFPTKSFSF